MTDFDKRLHAQLRHLIDDLTVAVDDDGHARYAPKNTLMFSNFIAALIELMPTLAARAQTAQAVPLLSDDEIRDVRDSFGDEPIGLYALSRAIESLVRSKLGAGVGWQPIETAPKDFVTEFDGWNGERVPNVSWAHPTYSPKGHLDWCVSEHETGFGWVNVAVKNLTHWMPLPPPPIVGKEGA